MLLLWKVKQSALILMSLLRSKSRSTEEQLLDITIKSVDFFQVFPLTGEEMEYKLRRTNDKGRVKLLKVSHNVHFFPSFLAKPNSLTNFAH